MEFGYPKIADSQDQVLDIVRRPRNKNYLSNILILIKILPMESVIFLRVNNAMCQIIEVILWNLV